MPPRLLVKLPLALPFDENSGIFTLPTELLSRVFVLLADNRPDVSACRLVCKTFTSISSPYLITKVAFALRLKTIERLLEVLAHPYFRRHVTHLVYDASWYDGDLATDWNEYVSACACAPRNFKDEELVQRRRRDAASLWKLSCRIPCHDDRDLQHMPDDSEFEHEETDGEMERPYQRIYDLDCHKGLPDYHELYAAQKRLIREGMPRRVLLRVFAGLPKLRHIVFTDFRGLARDGENYDACCRRLFGNTLQPRYDKVPGIHGLLRALADSPTAHIDSFTIGPHLFDGVETADPSWCSATSSNHWYLLAGSAKTEAVQQVFARLRFLRLPLAFDFAPLEMDFISPLEFTQQSLTHLSLPVTDLVEWKHDKVIARDSFKSVFDEFVGRLHFVRLQVLELAGWPLRTADLQGFLSRHVSTLREVFLTENVVVGDSAELARWAGQHLTLTGVNIRNYPDAKRGRPKKSSMASMTRENLENLWLAGRHNHAPVQPRLRSHDAGRTTSTKDESPIDKRRSKDPRYWRDVYPFLWRSQEYGNMSSA